MTPSAALQDPALDPAIRAAIAKAKLEDDVIRTLGSTPALGAIPYDQLKLIARVLSISVIEREKIAAADALRMTSTLPNSIQGHTKDFFGKDGSTLSAVASEYQLAASDLHGYASKVGDAGPAITSLASALDAVSTCLGGLDGDFYLSSVDRECVAAYAAVQTRMAESLSALDRL